jgi:hypothetical protein
LRRYLQAAFLMAAWLLGGAGCLARGPPAYQGGSGIDLLDELPAYLRATEYYRETSRPKAINVRVEGCRAGPGPPPAEAVESEQLAVRLQAALVATLRHYGYRVQDCDPAKLADAYILEVRMPEMPTIDLRVLAPSGEQRRSSRLRLTAPSGPAGEYFAQDAADAVAEDAFLLWYPGEGALQSKTRQLGVPYAPVTKHDFGGGSQLDDHVDAFRWRPFDVAAAAGPVAGQTPVPTEVRYEFRLRLLNDSGGSGAWPIAYYARDLATSEHSLPFDLPSCAWYEWSVRAIFSLDGATRASEWSGEYYPQETPPIAAPAVHPFVARTGVEYHPRRGGFVVSTPGDKNTTCPVGNERIAPVARPASQEAVATLLLVANFCDAGGVCPRERVASAAGELRGIVAQVLGRHGLNAAVLDGSELLADAPRPVPTLVPVLTSTTLLAQLSTPENIEYLRRIGLRYLLLVNASTLSGSGSWSGFGPDPFLVSNIDKTTTFITDATAEVIDVDALEVVATYKVGATGIRHAGVVFLLVFPVPYVNPDDSLRDTLKQVGGSLYVSLLTGSRQVPDAFRAVQRYAGD